MSASILVSEELQTTPEPSPPKPVIVLAVIGAVLSVFSTLVALDAAKSLRDFNGGGVVSTIIGALLVVFSLASWWFSFRSFGSARKRSSLLAQDELVAARREAAGGREDALIGMGYASASIIVSGLLLFILAKDGSIATTFFAQAPIRTAFHDVLKGFWTNIWAACIAEVLVLLFGLLVAVVRMLPGRAGAPLRVIAIIYCDVFRAIPALVLLLLIGFGVPLAGIPWLSDRSTVQLGILSLSLTYTAYVAEVYRAGLSSIHPSQSAAARSLGLSYQLTLRTILVPQAVRRVVPPLLNDFISLQKDTALLSSLAVLEALQVAKLYEASVFNLSPIVLVAGFFIIITIPQARLVDYLIERDASRRAGR